MQKESIPLRIWLLLIVALVVRIGWGLSRDHSAAAIEQLPDQREYLEIARNLLAGRGFFFYDPRFQSQQFAARTPGYPLFIAALGARPKLVLVGQAFLDTSTVLAVYLSARRWLDDARASFAALLVACNPFMIYFSGLLLTETLYTAMLLWGMEFCLRRWFVGCAILAFSILVRPSGLLLPVGIGLLALRATPDAQRLSHSRWRIPPGTTVILMCLLALFPWAYRNRVVLNQWIWTSTNSGITKYDGWNPNATGASDQRFTTRMPQLANLTEVKRDEFLNEQANSFARQHPFRVLYLAGVKLLRMFSPVPLSAEFGKPLYQWIAGLYSVPVFLLAMLGMLSGALDKKVLTYLLLPIGYFALVHAMTIGSLRYRVPLEPIFAILAASFVSPFAGDRVRRNPVASDRANGG